MINGKQNLQFNGFILAILLMYNWDSISMKYVGISFDCRNCQTLHVLSHVCLCGCFITTVVKNSECTYMASAFIFNELQNMAVKHFQGMT